MQFFTIFHKTLRTTRKYGRLDAGCRLPILEVCKIQFWQFCDCGGHIFTHGSSRKPELRYNYSAFTSYSVVNKTGNRIRILERCKCRLRYRLHHSSGLEQLRTQCFTISIKLCVRFGNVVGYLPVVYETNRK